jgi:hypothetical protein
VTLIHVSLKVFKLIGPSNDGRRHGRGTYLFALLQLYINLFFIFSFKKKRNYLEFTSLCSLAVVAIVEFVQYLLYDLHDMPVYFGVMFCLVLVLLLSMGALLCLQWCSADEMAEMEDDENTPLVGEGRKL